jgi:hypothetical protein
LPELSLLLDGEGQILFGQPISEVTHETVVPGLGGRTREFGAPWQKKKQQSGPERRIKKIYGVGFFTKKKKHTEFAFTKGLPCRDLAT